MPRLYNFFDDPVLLIAAVNYLLQHEESDAWCLRLYNE